MQQQLWGGAVAAVAVAIFSGLGERRHRRRRDLDRVGYVPWTLLQFAGLFAALLLASVALNMPQ